MLSDIEHRVMRRVGLTIRDWSAIRTGERVMVCVSGGVNSFCMALALEQLRRRLAFDFTLYPMLFEVDQDPAVVAEVSRRLGMQGIELECVPVPGATSLAQDWLRCRTMRKMVFDKARERNLDKVALGHNLDYLIETLMVNIFDHGRLAAQAVISNPEERPGLIRPLAYLEESLAQQLARQHEYRFVERTKRTPRRKQVHDIVEYLARNHPRIRRSLWLR